MRSFVSSYRLVAPATLDGVLDLLANEPSGWRPIAGGTDLMVMFEAGKLPYRQLCSLRRLKELRGIETRPETVAIGALATYTDVRRSEVLAREFPLLGRAAAVTGGIATQNRGTIGGNIVNASPAADTPPALLVYDAELELVSRGGSRSVPYSAFHTGYKEMDLRPDELVARIVVPRKFAAWRQYYRKVGTRSAQAIAKVGMAAALRMEEDRVADVRIALASVAPVPLRAVKTETVLRGSRLDPPAVSAAKAELADEISPIDDIRSTARYRLRVAQNLLGEFLEGGGGS